MATLKDVAARSRVSTATVSHVINNRSHVQPELRERVLSAIQELKYHPNAVARSLRTNRTRAVGIIIPDITNPFFPGIVRGAEDVLQKAGYTLVVGNSDGDTAKEAAYYRTFTAQRVDGFILIASESTRPPEYLLHHNIDSVPVVFVDRYYRGVRADTVLADNVRGSREAVSVLLEKGHRRIGIITGPLRLVNSRMRLDGYKQAFARFKTEIHKELIREGRYDIPSGYAETKVLLDLKNRPTALFICNAAMTLGCLRAIRERGVKVPQQLAVISFDDRELFELVDPSVSAVAQNPYELGSEAARILADRLSGNLTGPPQRKAFKTTLVIRQSTSCGPHGTECSDARGTAAIRNP